MIYKFTLIVYNTFMKYYLSGVAGTGMNALAQYLIAEGHTVFGSDRSFDNGLSLDYKVFLEKKGVEITPQDGSIIDKSFDACIFSAAVEDTVPDYQKALSLNIPIISRSIFLKNIYNKNRSIGIAGTSGKTTVTGLLATIFLENSIDATIFCGAEILDYSEKGIGGNFFHSKSNTLISEVDESDKKIGDYISELAVLTNISVDHMSLEDAKDLFSKFIKNSKKVIYNADCPVLKEIMRFTDIPIVSFSTKDASANIFIENIKTSRDSTSFDVSGIPFVIKVIGNYNIENAAAAIAIGHEMKISLPHISSSLSTFNGIKGRFELIQKDDIRSVIYDFAHNPAKIDSLLVTATDHYNSITLFYQPHGYAPFKKQLADLADIFAKRLRSKDRLIIGKMYDAGGSINRDLTSDSLSNILKERSINAFYAENREKLFSLMIEGTPTDAYFIVGARDRTLRDLSSQIVDLFKKNSG